MNARHPTSCSAPLSRRALLTRTANGFGALAASALFGPAASAGSLLARPGGDGPFTPRAPHFPARAKNVIFLYMDGGPAQMDTFDPKPELARWAGKPIPVDTPPTQFDNIGTVLPSYWDFKPGGESGLPVSDLFPELRRQADKLCVVRSMTNKFPEHTAANYLLHTGHNPAGRPSVGAWCAYGLGSEADNLPGYVVVDGGLTPPGGIECYGSGFLSPSYQGSTFRSAGDPVAHARGPHSGTDREVGRRRLLDGLDRRGQGRDDAIEAALDNYELAFRMQAAVPDLTDISDEPESVLERYGPDVRRPGSFARNCLLARRMAERDVRFVQLFHMGWDHHGNLPKDLTKCVKDTDQPSAALVQDLEERGLLDDTIVVWGGEFGRTVYNQGELTKENSGRDHHPRRFSSWPAGGGFAPGVTHGETCDHSYNVVRDPVSTHDLHATLLHQVGLAHERLTYRFQGRAFRLTDVHGELVPGILA